MIRKPILDSDLQTHLASLPEDGRDVFLLQDNTIRAVVVQATTMINQMKVNHNLGILETYVLGQAYIAAALLASTVKGNDRVQLNIECGGPIKGLSVEAWAIGAVRGYLRNVPIPIDHPLDSFDLSPFFGPGFLTISKVLEGHKQPFTGQVMLQYGNIAEDLANYFLISEQTNTTIALGIHMDAGGRVVGAGGLFLQKLPAAGNEGVEAVEAVCSHMPPLGVWLAQGKTGKDYVTEVFGQTHPEYLQKLPLGFSCPCDRKRFSDFLASLPDKEKEAILTDGPFPLHTSCFNCGTEYAFGKEELTTLFS